MPVHESPQTKDIGNLSTVFVKFKSVPGSQGAVPYVKVIVAFLLVPSTIIEVPSKVAPLSKLKQSPVRSIVTTNWSPAFNPT